MTKTSYDLGGIIESKTDVNCPFCRGQMIGMLDSMTGVYTLSCEIENDHAFLIQAKNYTEAKNRLFAVFPLSTT
jgi:hypothetical protein